jgi:hypothetical protein
MTTSELLTSLRDRGVVLTVRNDRLVFDAPVGVMTPELRDLLTEHKAELLLELNGYWKTAASTLLAQVNDDLRDDLLYLFEERAAICEFDGNMSRQDAERMAYEQLVQAVHGGSR